MSDNLKDGRAKDASIVKSFASKLWAFFNSLKLTLFVLISLATVSILGTVIEQNQPVEKYIEAYGSSWTRVILYMRVNDMYHSLWFLALLTMLSLNIIVCTIERFPPKWKSLLRQRPDNFDPSIIDRFSNARTVNVDGNADAVREKALKAFKARGFKTSLSGASGDYRLYAWKGTIGRFGSDFTHVSLILILLGAIIGNIYGYKDFSGIYVGGTITVPKADFMLRLDKFWIDYYETGQIRQYNSLLTVVEGDKEVMQKHIWVNEPLYYKGIRFYQSSYGVAWDKIEEAEIAFKKKAGKDPEPAILVKWGELARVPGTPYSVKLVGYTADFIYDEKTNTVGSRSGDANNPAANLEIYKADRLIARPWIFFKYPDAFPAIPETGDNFILTAYRGTMYSGISINKDPGTNVVWLGTAIMGVGFFLAFFVYHRRIWVSIRDSGGASVVKLGGTINKNTLVFEKELKDIVERLTKQ
ncbi:MAG: cytochrome c biogenesis protein ResB [Deltaproteobacteria bacterium]